MRRSRVLLMFGLAFASSCKPPSHVTLTILQTNDIHSHLRAAKTDPFGLGGLARMKTLIDRLRPKNPFTITLDAGDWSEGTWYYDLDIGANMLRFLDEMGFDAACLGNHDFLNGPDGVISAITAAKPSFPVLAANIDASNYDRRDELAKVLASYAIKNVNGLKVGLIGLTTDNLIFKSYMNPVQITDAVTAASDAAIAIRSKVDVLLLISHNDFSLNEKLAAEVPGLDAVISGHTHIKTPKAVMIIRPDGSTIPVVETGYWGKFVGELKLDVFSSGVVKFDDLTLHPVSPDIPEDPKIAAEVAAQDSQLSAKVGADVNEAVADSDVDLLQDDTHESLLGNLAVQSYRSETGADLSIEEISLTGISIQHGPVTRMDLHDVVPHVYDPKTGSEWRLRVWHARGKDVKLVFNVFYFVSGLLPNSSPLGWLSADNVDVTWTPLFAGEPGDSGARTKQLDGIMIGGKALDPNAIYRVALDDGFLRAIRTVNDSLHLGVDLSHIDDSGLQAWEAVTRYGQAVQHLRKDDLAIGRHTHVNGADLAIYDYDVDWDGHFLNVTVENPGLLPVSGAQVKCYSGIPNDLADFNSKEQVWQFVGQSNLPIVDPGETATARVNWPTKAVVPGYWPIRCAVEADGDLYHPNDAADKVFNVPSP